MLSHVTASTPTQAQGARTSAFREGSNCRLGDFLIPLHQGIDRDSSMTGVRMAVCWPRVVDLITACGRRGWQRVGLDRCYNESGFGTVNDSLSNGA